MINKLVLGTAQFGLPYGINNSTGKIPYSEAFQVLDYAHFNGIQYLDTAAAYGDAEKVIGNYLVCNPGNQFKIITKFNFKDSKTCESSLQRSLNELKADAIDTILFHSLQDYILHIEEIREFTRKYKGTSFKSLGVSLYTNEESEHVMSNEHIDTVQIPFNLFDNVSRRYETLKALKDKGKIVHTRSVFLQGLLLKPLDRIPDSLSELKEPLTQLSELALEYNLTMNQMALAYSLSFSLVDGVLIGVDNLKQLKENLAHSTTKLPIKLLDKIGTVNISNSELLNPAKWKI